MAFLKEEMDNICKTLELNISFQEKLLNYCRVCSKSQLLQQENLKKKISFCVRVFTMLDFINGIQ